MTHKCNFIELLLIAFEESNYADNNKSFEEMEIAGQKLKESLNEEQNLLFLQYQLTFDNYVFEEERILTKFILDFLKEIGK